MRLFGVFPSTITAFLLIIIGDFTNAASRPANSVLLSNIQTLTLKKDAKTSHRRVPTIPQLKCVGGNAKGLYEVDVMRCTNSGSSYDENNVEWTCKASLPPEFKLGWTEVICEGYEYPDDPYILKGSCGVEYRLILTDLGEQKYGNRGSDGVSDWKEICIFLFWILFLGALIWIFGTVCRINVNSRPRQPRGGGGWGGGDGNDPPPPYTPRPPRKTYSTSSGGEGWRPGFWSGAAGGASAGYMAGRMAGENRNNRTNPQAYGGRGGGGWFGGGNNNAAAGPSGSNTGRRSDSSSTYSSSQYESRGFGSTSRR